MYCPRCREPTKNVNPTTQQTANGRMQACANCARCGANKRRFLSSAGAAALSGRAGGAKSGGAARGPRAARPSLKELRQPKPPKEHKQRVARPGAAIKKQARGVYSQQGFAPLGTQENFSRIPKPSRRPAGYVPAQAAEHPAKPPKGYSKRQTMVPPTRNVQ